MRIAKDLLDGISDLLSFPTRTTHIKLRCVDLVWIQWLDVNCLYLLNYALEIAPDHAYGKGLVRGVLFFSQIPGPDHTPYIKALGLGVNTLVGG